jgi:hypothetical protein
MWILITLTALSVALILSGYVFNDDDHNLKSGGAIIFVLVCVFGWVMGGILNTFSFVETEITPNIMITQSSVIVEYQGNIQVFTEITEYSKIKNGCKFILRTDKNLYGFKTPIGDHIIIKE